MHSAYIIQFFSTSSQFKAIRARRNSSATPSLLNKSILLLGKVYHSQSPFFKADLLPVAFSTQDTQKCHSVKSSIFTVLQALCWLHHHLWIPGESPIFITMVPTQWANISVLWRLVSYMTLQTIGLKNGNNKEKNK